MNFGRVIANISSTLELAIDERIFPGAVAGIVDISGRREIVARGTFRYDDITPVCPDSIFDVASITKTVPVSSLALQAIDEKRISFDTKLIDILPQYRSRYRDEVRISHLLLHTLDFDFRLSSLKDESAEKILETIMTVPLKHPPGTTFFFSNATSIILGMVVEKIFGKNLPELAEERFFKPLRMIDTCFNPLDNMRIVPTEIDKWRNCEVRGIIHDESAFILNRIMTPGSAGIFSTAPDLLNFLEMILHGGQVNGHRYFSEELFFQIPVNRLSSINESAAYGWELNQKAKYMGECSSDKTIGKTGFTGCAIVADIEKGRAFTFLSNYTWPDRRHKPDVINSLRRAVADAVFGTDW